MGDNTKVDLSLGFESSYHGDTIYLVISYKEPVMKFWKRTKQINLIVNEFFRDKDHASCCTEQQMVYDYLTLNLNGDTDKMFKELLNFVIDKYSKMVEIDDKNNDIYEMLTSISYSAEITSEEMRVLKS